MIIVTAGTSDFAPYMNLTKQRAEAFGHKVKLHFYVVGKDWPYNSKKIPLVKKILQESGETVVWIDGDAVLHSSIHELDTSEFDIGVTPKPIRKEKLDRVGVKIYGAFNPGVFVAKPNQKVFDFLDAWSPISKSHDSTTFRKLLEKDGVEKKEARRFKWGMFENREVVSLKGMTIKFFPYIYNYIYHLREPLPEDVKIVHFKSKKSRVKRFKEYCG